MLSKIVEICGGFILRKIWENKALFNQYEFPFVAVFHGLMPKSIVNNNFGDANKCQFCLLHSTYIQVLRLFTTAKNGSNPLSYEELLNWEKAIEYQHHQLFEMTEYVLFHIYVFICSRIFMVFEFREKLIWSRARAREPARERENIEKKCWRCSWTSELKCVCVRTKQMCNSIQASK